MAKSKHRIANNFGGNKKHFLAEILRNTNLEKTMVVPLEIGKSCNKALLADYLGTVFEGSFEFHNSLEGMTFLHHTLSRVSAERQMQTVVIGMEATGHYSKLPARHLHELGYRHLFVLNPLITRKIREAGLTWSKTDDLDLGAVGQGLLSGYGTPYRPQEPVWQDLRELCRFRRFQVNRGTALKNKIHSLLDQLLPGVSALSLFKDDGVWHPAALEFFGKYPNVAAVSRLRPQSIDEFFRRRGRRLTGEASHELLAWSRTTFQQESAGMKTQEGVMQALLEELKTLQKNLSELEVQALGFLVRIPAVLLLTIHWVGVLRAAEFAGEISPLEQYPNSRTLLKAAGLDPTTRQSASQESPMHPISKRGSVRLRYISLQIGEGLMQHNDYFSMRAQPFFERGQTKGYACVATTTRFLRVAHALLTQEQPFQPPNGLGVSKDPLLKIADFLHHHKASDRIEEYTQHARRFLKGSSHTGPTTCQAQGGDRLESSLSAETD